MNIFLRYMKQQIRKAQPTFWCSQVSKSLQLLHSIIIQTGLSCFVVAKKTRQYFERASLLPFASQLILLKGLLLLQYLNHLFTSASKIVTFICTNYTSKFREIN